MKYAITRNFPTIALKSILWRTSFVRTLFLMHSQTILERFVRIFNEFSRKYGVYVVAGSLLLPDLKFSEGKIVVVNKGRIYNTSLTFDQNGNIIGIQRKVHLVDIEGPSGLDISNGELSSIEVIKTDFANLGIAICYDSFHTDAVEILAKKGAEVLVQPSANPEEWTKAQEEDWKRGCWLMVQRFEQIKYGINPMMVGKMLDLKFEGVSSIVTKAKYTKDRSGYLVKAKSKDEEEVIYADLS